MSTDKMEKIYKKTLNNSVGREKKCFYAKNIKKTVNKIALQTLILVFIASSLMGCTAQLAKNNDLNNTNLNESENYTTVVEFEHGAYEITMYQVNRVYDLLNSYNLNNFSYNGNKKHYNCSSEDFMKIEELDESYLYGFYLVSDRETLNEVCKVLGYEDIKDYLVKNNYVDKDNNPDVNVWYEYNKANIDKIMSQEHQRGK